MNTERDSLPTGHPYKVGDKVTLAGRSCEVACCIPLLVRFKNGTTTQVSSTLLRFNYGRRGK